MNVSIHIERLILDGLPVTSGEGALVQAAVESNLAQLLADEAWPLNLRSGGAVRRVPGGSIQLDHQSNSARLGHQIARAVQAGIGQAIPVRAQDRIGNAPSGYRPPDASNQPTKRRPLTR